MSLDSKVKSALIVGGLACLAVGAQIKFIYDTNTHPFHTTPPDKILSNYPVNEDLIAAQDSYSWSIIKMAFFPLIAPSMIAGIYSMWSLSKKS